MEEEGDRALTWEEAKEYVRYHCLEKYTAVKCSDLLRGFRENRLSLAFDRALCRKILEELTAEEVCVKNEYA